MSYLLPGATEFVLGGRKRSRPNKYPVGAFSISLARCFPAAASFAAAEEVLLVSLYFHGRGLLRSASGCSVIVSLPLSCSLTFYTPSCTWLYRDAGGET